MTIDNDIFQPILLEFLPLSECINGAYRLKLSLKDNEGKMYKAKGSILLDHFGFISTNTAFKERTFYIRPVDNGGQNVCRCNSGENRCDSNGSQSHYHYNNGGQSAYGYIGSRNSYGYVDRGQNAYAYGDHGRNTYGYGDGSQNSYGYGDGGQNSCGYGGQNTYGYVGSQHSYGF